MIARIPLPFISVITTGFAIFSMFFGSGNLIFPIELGQRTGIHVSYGYWGLFITGVLFTLLGLLGIVLYQGDHHAFFNRLGKIPGTAINICVLVMIGPLTGLPRAINVLHQVLEHYIPDLSLFTFILCFLSFIFAACFRRERVMPLLGYVISPLLVSMLLFLVFYGWLYGGPICADGPSKMAAFYRGISEGYATMDMLAAFHFAPLAVTHLRRISNIQFGPRRVFYAALGASAITCGLLAITYIGLSYLGARFCYVVTSRNPVTIAYLATTQCLPAWMGNGLHILFMLAIISTAISLTTIFTDYLREDVFNESISHMHALLITLILSGCSAIGGLYAILRFEKPFLQIFYPPLIVLTLCNIAYKAWKFKPVKRPVAGAFALSIIRYFFWY